MTSEVELESAPSGKTIGFINRALMGSGVRYIMFAVSVAILALMLWRLRDIVLVCFGGIIGAIILRGLAAPLVSRFGMAVKWALATTLASVLIVSGGLVWFFGNQTVNELGELQNLIPKAIHQLNDSLQGSSAGRAFIDVVNHAAGDSKILANMGTLAGSLIEGLTALSLILFLSVYFAFAPHVYFEGFLSLVAPSHRNRARYALIEATNSLKKWLVAQLYAMVIIGLLVGISSAILHIPLALLLGVFAGFLEFIPAIGPIIFTIPAVLIAFTQSLASVVNVLVVYFVVQQLESNVITPLLQQNAVRVPPAITLLSVVVGGLLLGPMGIVFGIPMTVVLISLAKHLYVEDKKIAKNGASNTAIPIIERF